MRLGNTTNRFGALSYGRHNGIRFTGVSGLSGATITGATLTFRAAASDSGPFIGDWYAHKAAAPGTFTTTTSNISDTAQRPRTTATCEGDGSDFGNWSNGVDAYFTGDGVNTIADIIQELADSYDPSTIVLLHFYTSGTGERNSRQYESQPSNAIKLVIDYTTATGDLTATPDPVTIPISIPAPSIVAGNATVTPDPVVIPIDIPAPTVVAGGVTATPDPVTMALAIPTPTAVAGGVTATPDPIEIAIAIPSPNAFGEGTDITLTPNPVVITMAIPTPTAVVGGVTVTPDPVAIPIVIPTPTVNATALPDPVVITMAVPAPSVIVGGVTVTPDPVVIPIVIPLPSILGGGEQFVAWGIWSPDTLTWLGIEQYADPADFAPGSVFRLHVGMYTSAVPVPINAYLYNVTDGVKVADSDITGTATAYEILRSSTFSLPSGLKKYRLMYGGESGGVFYFHGGKVLAESS